MTNLYAKKLEKIFNQVDKLATKGKDNKLEYTKYIDELINKGDYTTFLEMLYQFYRIDTIEMRDVLEVKAKTWDEICFQTKTPFLTKLSKLYKQKKVYQQSYNIYSEDTNKTQISLSNKLSVTYSITGLTPSINLVKNGEILDLYVYDSDITSIKIQKGEWGNDIPLSVKPFEEFEVSYLANSSTSFKPTGLIIGDLFTMSVTSMKQFIPNQLISVTYSGGYIEGVIQSYDRITGETVLDITDTVGSQTHSMWIVNYLSGPKAPTYSTSIPLTQGGSYIITTTQKDNITFEYLKYNYKFLVQQDPLLGQIYENDIYTPNAKYLIENKKYSQIVGERRIYLEAIKVGSTSSVIFDYENPALSDDTNLLNRYSAAINYLLS